MSSLIDLWRVEGSYGPVSFAVGYSERRAAWVYEWWPTDAPAKLRSSVRAYRNPHKAEVALMRALAGRIAHHRYPNMNQPQQPKPPVRGPLVEDETVVGGIDENGAAVIRPKTPDGRADESVRPTDPREGKRG